MLWKRFVRKKNPQKRSINLWKKFLVWKWKLLEIVWAAQKLLVGEMRGVFTGSTDRQISQQKKLLALPGTSKSSRPNLKRQGLSWTSQDIVVTWPSAKISTIRWKQVCSFVSCFTHCMGITAKWVIWGGVWKQNLTRIWKELKMV